MPSMRRGTREVRSTSHAKNAGRASTGAQGATKPLREAASTLHVRVAGSLKTEAVATLEAIGLSTSEAVRLFLHRVVVERRLPLDLEVPNAVTQAAIEEAREMARRPRRFASPEAMFNSLEDASRR